MPHSHKIDVGSDYMMEISSENINILKFIKEQSYSKVTIDIETLDHDNIWTEPMASFSFSFVPDNPLPVVAHFPTFAMMLTDVKEEKELLQNLHGIFSEIPKSTTLIGHSISYELKWKKAVHKSYCNGFDIPKILTRGKEIGINFEFIKGFRTFDLADEVYSKFNHAEHGLTTDYGIKTVLSCEDLEKLFNITRTTEKLGPKVRKYFDEKKFKDILLYNCCDTIAESIIYRILEHQLNYKKQSMISCKKKFEHIAPTIKIEDTETWKKIVEKSLKL